MGTNYILSEAIHRAGNTKIPFRSIVRTPNFQNPKMGWSYSESSMEDLMKLIESFIDMLILASGYQSTGRLDHWDSRNIRKCFQWALFLENVSKDLTSSVDYRDSVEELDASLYELTRNPRFPKGLAPLSCATVGRARDILSKHLIHTLPLRESHLKAVISASVDMDFSKLKGIDDDCLNVYLEKLMRNPSEGDCYSESRDFVEVSNISSPDAVRVDGRFSVSAIEQIGRRHQAVSSLSTVEAGLECIWRTLGESMHNEIENTSGSEQTKHLENLIAEEMPVELNIWSRWRSRSLSYMLDKRTLRLISGGNLICSAPEGQWTQMFKQLNISAEADNLSEAVELLLLGCVKDKWNNVIEHAMSISYESLTISRIFHYVFNFPPGKSTNLFLKDGLINPKEKHIIDYLEVLLNNQLNLLWNLSPVLAAVAVPSWSRLFKSYLCELESQLRGNCLATRHCSCIVDAVEHKEWVLLSFSFGEAAPPRNLNFGKYRGNKLNIKSHEGWIQNSKAPALEHTLKLFPEIFSISNRRVYLRDATVNNLIKEGYHGWSGLVLRILGHEKLPEVPKLIATYTARDFLDKI